MERKPFLFLMGVGKRGVQIMSPESILDKGRELLEPLRKQIIFSSALAVGGNNGQEIMFGLNMLRYATEKEEDITRDVIFPAKTTLRLPTLNIIVEREVRKKAREFAKILGLAGEFGEGTINWHIHYTKEIQEEEKAKLKEKKPREITIFLLKKNSEVA